VRGYIAAGNRDELSNKRSELKDIEANPEDIETQFTQNMGFLSRCVLNEQEFVKANNMARNQRSGFQESKETLAWWIEEQAGREDTDDRTRPRDDQDFPIRLPAYGTQSAEGPSADHTQSSPSK